MKINSLSQLMLVAAVAATDEVRIKQLQGWLPEAKAQFKAQ